MYQYSLGAFVVVFSKAVDRATASEELAERIENLIDSITYNVFAYAQRGLFERHKLIFATQVCCLIADALLCVSTFCSCAFVY